MAEKKDPFADFGGSIIANDKDPFAEFGGSKLRGKPLDTVAPTGSEPLPIGSKPFLPQVSTKIPSVLTPKGQVGYQEQVKDFKPIVQKPIFESAKAKQQRESGYENIAPLLSGLQSTVSSFYKIPRYIYDVFAIPQNLVADLANVPELKANYDNVSKGALNPLSYLEYAGDYTKGKAKEWESKQRKYDEDITTQLFKSGDYGGAGLQIYDNVIASAPSIAAMFLSGGVANAAKLGSASSKIATALPFASAQNQVLLENQEIPDWLKPVNAAFNGLSEILLEGKFGTTAILSGATKIAAEKGADAAIKSTKDFVYNYIKKALSKVQPVTDVVSNAAEEMATTLSQNIIARATGEDPNRGIMDGVFDAGIVGGAQGAGASAIRKGLDVFANKKSKGKVDDLTKKRDDIVNDLDNDAIPDSVKEQLEISLEGINQEINNTLDENRNEINNLPEETKLEVAELADKIETINESLQNETISETSKTILEQDLKDAQAELDAKFKIAKPTFDTEEQLIAEGQQAEAEYTQTGDQVTYEQKIKELEEREKNLVPAPEDAEIGKPEVAALKDVESTAKALDELSKENPTEVENILGEGIVYHGTKKDFDEFDEKKMGDTDDGWYGKGFYFHSDRDRGGYGDIVKAAKIDLKNPIVLPIQNSGQYLYDIIGKEAGLDESFRNEGSQNIIREIGSDRFSEIAKKLGYDGVVVNYAQGTQEVVAFDKKSIKQATPKSISEAYHQAKADGSNPELVEAVENLLKTQTDAIQVEAAGQVPVLTEATVGEEVVKGKPETKPEVAAKEGFKAEEVISDTGVSLDVIVDPVNIELKNNKIEGKLFNEQESVELQKEIESKYNNSDTPINKRFGQENEDIRQNAFNYDSPAAQKNVNGVDVRIVLGLVEGKAYSGKRRQTYLLYADGKIAGKFYSLSDAKKVVNFIEANLVKSLPTQKTEATPQQLKAEKPIVSEEAVSENIEQTPAQEVEQLRAKEQAIKAVDYKGKKISDVKIGDVYYDYYAGAIRKFERLPNREKENGEEVYFSKVVDENIFSEGSPDDVIGFNESDYLKSRPAETFLENAENLFYKNPFMDVLEVFGNDGKQVGWVALNKVDSDTVDVDGVVSITGGKRKGGGSQIMKMVTKNADRTGVTLTLVPEPLPRREAKGFETPEKLQAFYEKFGFVKDKKKPTMTRKPQPVLPQTIEEQIAELRIREEVELRKAIEYNEKYQTDFKIDRAKITDAKDLKKFDDIYDKYDKLITPLLPKKEAPAKAEPKLKSKVATRLLFKKAVDLFYDISGTEGSAKKRTISAKRRTFMEQNPSIKYIDDNWPNISKQLKEKGLLEKSKGCP